MNFRVESDILDRASLQAITCNNDSAPIDASNARYFVLLPRIHIDYSCIIRFSPEQEEPAPKLIANTSAEDTLARSLPEMFDTALNTQNSSHSETDVGLMPGHIQLDQTLRDGSISQIDAPFIENSGMGLNVDGYAVIVGHNCCLALTNNHNHVSSHSQDQTHTPLPSTRPAVASQYTQDEIVNNVTIISTDEADATYAAHL